MAVTQNWVRYEVVIEESNDDVGWVEVSPKAVFKDTLILRLFSELIEYSNGQLFINEK